MYSGTIRVQVHQGAGYCVDLLAGACALYRPQNGAGKSKRLESCLRYLQEELPDPHMNLAALFFHEQAVFRITERFSGLLFGHLSFDRLMRELSIANPVSLLEELLAFWLNGPSDPALVPEQREGFDRLPPPVQESLRLLYQNPSSMLSEAVQLLRRVDDRLKVVYQTHREALAEFQLALEGKTFAWNEAGLQQEVDNGLLLPRQTEQNWLAGVSLLTENRLVYLGGEEDKSFLAVGMESLDKMERLCCKEPENGEEDRLPQLFHALSDPLRMQILDLLSQRSYYTGELGRALNLTVPALLYHLNLLKEAGLIEGHPQGRRVYYGLTEGGFASLIRQLEQRFDCAPIRKKREESSV